MCFLTGINPMKMTHEESLPETQGFRVADRRNKVCPECHSSKFAFLPAPENQMLVSQPRVCEECETRYLIPQPKWVGVLTYLMGAGVLYAVWYDAFERLPNDDFMRLNWIGRIVVLAIACWLFWLGTLVLRGRVK